MSILEFLPRKLPIKSTNTPQSIRRGNPVDPGSKLQIDNIHRF